MMIESTRRRRKTPRMMNVRTVQTHTTLSRRGLKVGSGDEAWMRSNSASSASSRSHRFGVEVAMWWEDVQRWTWTGTRGYGAFGPWAGRAGLRRPRGWLSLRPGRLMPISLARAVGTVGGCRPAGCSCKVVDAAGMMGGGGGAVSCTGGGALPAI